MFIKIIEINEKLKYIGNINKVKDEIELIKNELKQLVFKELNTDNLIKAHENQMVDINSKLTNTKDTCDKLNEFLIKTKELIERQASLNAYTCTVSNTLDINIDAEEQTIKKDNGIIKNKIIVQDSDNLTKEEAMITDNIQSIKNDVNLLNITFEPKLNRNPKPLKKGFSIVTTSSSFLFRCSEN